MKLKALSFAFAAVLSLSACSVPEPVVSPSPEPFEGITIVSSTNVWGNIAQSVGGDLVQVVSIIDSFSQDPHSYEASARDQLSVNGADLIIANGGGYDSFMDTLAQAAGNDAIVYAYLPDELDDAAKEDEQREAGHAHTHGNEHVWYDFHAVEDFASRLAGALAALDPENSIEYSDNLVDFLTGIEIVEDRVAELSVNLDETTVITSEPVADYLLTEFGFEDLTPQSFSQAIEEELDVSPKDLLEIQQLIKTGAVDLFVVNVQTGSVQIDALIALAIENDVAIVEVSELLPAEISYAEWMDNTISAIEQGLRK